MATRVILVEAGSKYRWVMAEGASNVGNIASSCAQRNCKYNFSNNTYTVLNTGITYNAGVSPEDRNQYPKIL